MEYIFFFFLSCFFFFPKGGIAENHYFSFPNKKTYFEKS